MKSKSDFLILFFSQIIAPSASMLLLFKTWTLDDQTRYAIIISAATLIGAAADLGLGTIGLKSFKSKSFEFKVALVFVRLFLASAIALLLLSLDLIGASVLFAVFYTSSLSPQALNFIGWKTSVNLLIAVCRFFLLCGIAFSFASDYYIDPIRFIIFNFIIQMIAVFVLLSICSTVKFSLRQYLFSFRQLALNLSKYKKSLLLPLVVALSSSAFPYILSLLGKSSELIAAFFLIERVASISRVVPSFIIQKYDVSVISLKFLDKLKIYLSGVLFSCISMLAYNYLPGHKVELEYFYIVAGFSFAYYLSFFSWYFGARLYLLDIPKWVNHNNFANRSHAAINHSSFRKICSLRVKI